MRELKDQEQSLPRNLSINAAGIGAAVCFLVAIVLAALFVEGPRFDDWPQPIRGSSRAEAPAVPPPAHQAKKAKNHPLTRDATAQSAPASSGPSGGQSHHHQRPNGGGQGGIDSGQASPVTPQPVVAPTGIDETGGGNDNGGGDDDDQVGEAGGSNGVGSGDDDDDDDGWHGGGSHSGGSHHGGWHGHGH